MTSTTEEVSTFQALHPNREAGPFPKMSPDIKAKWVAALRSGEYHQGTGSLAAGSSDSTLYCCLGVLCEIGVQEGVIEKRPTKDWEYHTSYRYITPEIEGVDSPGGEWVDTIPSAEMDTWAGVAAGASARLVRMNDSEQRTFADIADWIEVHL